jgi:hypothetical protein
MIERWERQISAAVPRMEYGPLKLNVSSGNLIARLVLPSGGAFTPTPRANVQLGCTDASEFGYGWTTSHKQSLTEVVAALRIVQIDRHKVVVVQTERTPT